MNLGFIKVYRNNSAFAKLHWLLFKLFKIKRTIPCGRRKKEYFLSCELWPLNEDNSELIQTEYGYEVYCKCCGSLKMMGAGHPKTIAEAALLEFQESLYE